jgi:hypothetical protein
VIGLLLLHDVSCAEAIECDFTVEHWHYVNRTLLTCNMINQPIIKLQTPSESHPAFIASTIDRNIQGFSILNEPNVRFLPDNLSVFPNLVAVSLWNCSIKSINEHHFKGLQQLTQLSLARNKIRQINENAFKDNVILEYLDLDNNKIREFHADLFKPLQNLKFLHLNNNLIRFIDPEAFKVLSSLEVLFIDYNDIHTLNSKLFENLQIIRVFSISHNQLESISWTLLRKNSKLESINLGFNRIKSIDADLFKSMNNLRLVDLRSNDCIDLEFAKANLPALKTELEKNCLQSVESLIVEMKSLKQKLKAKDTELEALKIKCIQVGRKLDSEEEFLKKQLANWKIYRFD